MHKTEDEKYMSRCLQLAHGGMYYAKPNPMVGAVIVCDGRIIGEGYHIRCGEGHAEVNAFAALRPADERLLPRSTLYVSLEPCSHYGRTPPCASLIIRKGVRRVVVGCIDPFARVHGRGIAMLREAGIEVTVGVLEDECKSLNRRFFTFHEKRRPYITLKWAQTANGFIDDNHRPAVISTSFTRMLCHKLRAENDAILVGRVTAERDKPQLNVRYWHGEDPMRIVLGGGMDMAKLLDELHGKGVQSLLVEGGAMTINSFINAGLWDCIRVETAPLTVSGGTRAPELPAGIRLSSRREYDGNAIAEFTK